MLVGIVYFGYGLYVFEREADSEAFTFAGSVFLSLECMLTGYPADAYEMFMPMYVLWCMWCSDFVSLSTCATHTQHMDGQVPVHPVSDVGAVPVCPVGRLRAPAHAAG